MGIVRQKLNIKQILHLKSYNPKMVLNEYNQKIYDDFMAKQNAFVTPRKVKKIKQDLEPTTKGEIDFNEDFDQKEETQPVVETSVSESL